MFLKITTAEPKSSFPFEYHSQSQLDTVFSFNFLKAFT